MGAYVITVDIQLHTGARDAFRAAIEANARASVRDEPGCRRFDVLETAGVPGHFLLYEIYNDRAAFDAHLKTPHFARFDAESAPLVSTKSVVEYDLICEGSAG